MSKDVSVHVEHVTRVEGHGNIILNVKEGKLEKIEWQVSEAPRFFEAMLRGRSYNELRSITSRICGICSIGHSLASLKATEDALNIDISEQSKILRKLAINAENMQSHILHIGYLALPDFLGVKSVFPLASSDNKGALLKVIKLHRLANEMSDLICGRTIHPITLIVGGFSKVPKMDELLNLRKRLIDGLETVIDVAEFVQSKADIIPNFTRETEYVALTTNDEYALYEGDICSSDTGRLTDYHGYKEIMNEYFVPQSTAFHAKHKRDSYMVGALARYNINSRYLSTDAKDVAHLFGLKAMTYNPFFNTIAQLVEFAHNIEDSIQWIDLLISKNIKDEQPVKPDIKANRGVGIVEVPRGILVHDYTFDKNGNCTKANCIIPTNQNHANIQLDLESFIPKIIDKPKKDIELLLEMLVRAYDPCISCSTHYLNVRFV